MIEALQKLVPWLPTLPVPAKISLTGVVGALAFFAIAIIWSHPQQPPAEVSLKQVQDLLYELETIRSDSANRFNEVEPLAERAKALIGGQFSVQAGAINQAQQQLVSTSDVARALETQLKIVKDKLSERR